MKKNTKSSGLSKHLKFSPKFLRFSKKNGIFLGSKFPHFQRQKQCLGASKPRPRRYRFHPCAEIFTWDRVAMLWQGGGKLKSSSFEYEFDIIWPSLIHCRQFGYFQETHLPKPPEGSQHSAWNAWVWPASCFQSLWWMWGLAGAAWHVFLLAEDWQIMADQCHRHRCPWRRRRRRWCSGCRCRLLSLVAFMSSLIFTTHWESAESVAVFPCRFQRVWPIPSCDFGNLEWAETAAELEQHGHLQPGSVRDPGNIQKFGADSHHNGLQLLLLSPLLMPTMIELASAWHEQWGAHGKMPVTLSWCRDWLKFLKLQIGHVWNVCDRVKLILPWNQPACWLDTLIIWQRIASSWNNFWKLEADWFAAWLKQVTSAARTGRPRILSVTPPLRPYCGANHTLHRIGNSRREESSVTRLSLWRWTRRLCRVKVQSAIGAIGVPWIRWRWAFHSQRVLCTLGKLDFSLNEWIDLDFRLFRPFNLVIERGLSSCESANVTRL